MVASRTLENSTSKASGRSGIKQSGCWQNDRDSNSLAIPQVYASIIRVFEMALKPNSLIVPKAQQSVTP